jgi:rubrerythrin
MENDSDFDRIEEMILEEGKKSPAKKVLICPVCNSRHIYYYLGGYTGYMYRCRDCGYIGAYVLEE